MRLNGQEIPTPFEDPKIEYISISRSERAVTGRMRTEIVTTKYMITLNYRGLKPEESRMFLDAHRSKRLVEFEFTDSYGSHKIEAYVTVSGHELYSPKPQYHANIAVTIEEA